MGCGLVRVSRSELDAWVADPKRSIHATVFDSFDGVIGLPGGSHYNPAVAKTQDGRLWFLQPDGVSVVDPHHLSFNKLPPPVHTSKSPPITSLTIRLQTEMETSTFRRVFVISKSTTRRLASSFPKRYSSATSWKAGIAIGRMLALAGKRSIAIFLPATTASA
jgi:hypothetical protein